MTARAEIALTLVIATVTIGASLLWTVSASPQERLQCGPLVAIERSLKQNVDEHLFAGGADGEHVMRFYVSPTRRGWTMLAVKPNGLACVIAGGDNFDTATPPQPGRGT